MKIEQKIWTKESGWQDILVEGISKEAQIVFVFGGYSQFEELEFVEDIKIFYPSAKIIGCSTAGEIMGDGVSDDHVVLTAVNFENTGIDVSNVDINSGDDGYNAGKSLATGLKKDDLVHVFVLSDGLNVNGSRLAQGFISCLPPHVAVTGGLAGDAGAFKDTLVLLDDNAKSKRVVAVGFYGTSLNVSYGSQGGWESFGQDRLITKSKGNVLYELDGKSALDLYKKYLGDQAAGLPATGLLFPLSIREKDSETILVRTILAVDEKEGSLTFAGDVPEGYYAQLMKANFDRLVDGASLAAEESKKGSNEGRKNLALLVSCVGRKLVLKQRVEEEVEVVQETLGANAILTGFYSYGEICPTVFSENQCELHNQTMTITTLSES